MISNPTIQGAYINIPLSDWKFFKELVQLYVKDCRRRGVEKVTTDGYEYACRKFLEYIGEDVRCSELRQELS